MSLELSSFQLDTTLSLRAAAAPVLERDAGSHGSLRQPSKMLRRRKERIFQRGQAAIVNHGRRSRFARCRYQSSRACSASSSACAIRRRTTTCIRKATT